MSNLRGFEKIRVDLALPLLMLRGRRGILACAYLNHHTAEVTGEAIALVRGVHSFEEMCSATVFACSTEAQKQGVFVGMTGAEALACLR
ncbi:DUF1805 domain-containing protein [Chitinivibrio alkaliphilus]|uniref:DUF1805 domain-containing protein n=1 Tax=Chitinivibrio alkaliphilus ACht1 TaxID=1313304 RepID=U7DEM5_9BACT|nr:DUF1805 domain-containing protein [Chitinivibrio alkaliphilus]ERP39391.1 hypothetical protein CALK_0192 [Chitinivibrio alkaliphilus ACht1]